jgi:hypothetical protein
MPIILLSKKFRTVWLFKNRQQLQQKKAAKKTNATIASKPNMKMLGD